MSVTITSPQEFFGFQLGRDRSIARWEKIVEYFHRLEYQSSAIKVVEMGPSTEGNPFILVIISSPDNLSNLDRLREINLRLSDPRGLPSDQVENLSREGKAVICQSMSLHATEIGGTQMAPELAFDLCSIQDDETSRILDNVIFLMVPCFNPDGQIMVTDWYNRWIGTEFEGCSLPWLYHKYAGHDNNRDAFQLNLVESRYMAAILFRDWKPHAYLDHHHFGSYGPRFYVPPYCEPIHPNADPLIWREHSWYGAHMAYKLEEAGKAGVVNAATFSAWGHLGFHWITAYHNIAGMLTESASARLASPLYIHNHQLKGDWRETLPNYDAQTNFPHPWPGGWWRLRDIVEQQKISAWATLDLAARHRETVLTNGYLKAKRQIEAGAHGRPHAYIIPQEQHDPLTAATMVEKLLEQGIEIHIGQEGILCAGAKYAEGTYVISLAQPKSGLIKTLLDRTRYPDSPWTRTRAGAPMNPYDTATDTIAEFMGVRVDAASESVEGRLDQVTAPLRPTVKMSKRSRHGYALDCRWNDSFAAVNQILARDCEVYRTTGTIETREGYLPPGAFLISDNHFDLVQEVAQGMHLPVAPLRQEMHAVRPIQPLRVGLYQGYLGGNADEGWTRLLLEQFEFPYATVKDSAVVYGDLRQRFDVLIIPSASAAMLTGVELEEWWTEHHPHWEFPTYPPEYRPGFGEEGTEAIKTFVSEGGTLVALDHACEFAIEKLELKARDVVKDLDKEHFLCPGSTLRARFDNHHPLAYGMPE